MSDKFNIELDSIPNSAKNYAMHGIHPYPAKYIPQIPLAIINYLKIPRGSWVLDPFCGSGTTLSEANMQGLNAVGVDSNPIGCLISEVKTTVYSPRDLDKIRDFLSSLQAEWQQKEITYEEIPVFMNRDHWFQENMQYELTKLRKEIFSYPDEKIVKFLKVAFSAIIVRCSNQESDTRWAAKQKNLPEGRVLKEFSKQVELMLKGAEEFSGRDAGTCNVFCADSRSMPFIVDGSISCVITSPPYMNSFDYYLYHKLRMFWLGLDHHATQEMEIGSRNKHCDNKNGPNDYFDNMERVATEVRKKLIPGGVLCFVIGDSIYEKQLVRMDEAYEAFMSRVGFSLFDIYSFDQRKYTRSFTQNLKTAEKKTHIMFFQ